MSAHRRLAFLLCTCIIAGCAVGPDYHRPDVPLPKHFSGQGMNGLEKEATESELATWWQSFNDPLLTHFISLALEKNLSVAQAMARVSQARALLGTADAALLPSGIISGSAGRSYQSIETPLGQVLNSMPGYNRWGSAYEADMSASWEVDLFGGLRRSREAALADYQSSLAGSIAIRLAVAAQTADIYITIREQQTRLNIAHQQVGIQQELLKKVRLLYERGVAADYQVQQAQSALAQMQAAVPAIQMALDEALNALDVMLAAPPGTYRAQLSSSTPIPVVPRITHMGSPAELLQRRPDIIAAERRLAATNAKIGEAIAEYYPTFSLGGVLGSATAISSGHLFSNGASQISGLLGLRWRLFDFSRINAQIDLAKRQDAEALIIYRQTVLKATEDVENAFSALSNRTAQVSSTVQSEASLSKSRASTWAAYQKGVASLIDVLHADESFLYASDAKVTAQAAAARAAVASFRSLGGGWQAKDTEKISDR